MHQLSGTPFICYTLCLEVTYNNKFEFTTKVNNGKLILKNCQTKLSSAQLLDLQVCFFITSYHSLTLQNRKSTLKISKHRPHTHRRSFNTYGLPSSALLQHTASAVNTRLFEVFSWNTLLIRENGTEEQLEPGQFVPANNLPASIELWIDRMFFAVPRYKPGVLATLVFFKMNCELPSIII